MKNLKEKIAELKKGIEEITPEDLKKRLRAMVKFYRYSFGNTLLIHSQNPEASQVASFLTWKKNGRFVKKGEKAIKILAPRLYKDKKDEEKEDKEKEQVLYFAEVPVFDISQTEGAQFGDQIETSGTDIETIKKMLPDVTIEKAPLEHERKGEYYPNQKKIVLNSNYNESENIATLLHEASHLLLGHDEKIKREVAEREAETLAFLFCEKFGVKDDNQTYLKAWGGIAENLEKIFKVFSEAIRKIEN